jgi:hypothetical protein
MYNYQDKLIETLEKLNFTLENFNKTTTTEEGGENDMNKFEELLAKYGKTEEDVTFEIEGLSDEELEAKFEEVFVETDDDNGDEGDLDAGAEGEDGADSGDGDDGDPEGDSGDGEGVEPVVENMSISFEISHDDIRSGLYSLLRLESEECWPWIVEVYDNKFIYQDYEENKFYRRGYSVDGDDVSLDENKTEVFSEWLTQAEKDAIASLKSDYAALKEFKDQYDAAELKAQKDEVFGCAEYDDIRESDDFKKLVESSAEFSLDEIKVKCDLLFAAHMKQVGNFAKKPEKQNKLGFNFNAKPAKKSAYGKLFD